VARDQARAGSDVDLLVDLPQGTSLLDHSALKLELEDLLQQKVDLIRRRNLKPSLRQRVEAEAVARMSERDHEALSDILGVLDRCAEAGKPVGARAGLGVAVGTA